MPTAQKSMVQCSRICESMRGGGALLRPDEAAQRMWEGTRMACHSVVFFAEVCLNTLPRNKMLKILAVQPKAIGSKS